VQRGSHLLIDCRNVARDVCLNDKLLLETMAAAAERAGATVISSVRYKFGQDSPPGFTAIVMLDESHCSAHTYADVGLIAMDIFTCGTTDPAEILREIRTQIDLGDVTVTRMARFVGNPEPAGMPHKKANGRALAAVAER
jgi:S-adenosylmethionine decarboxylase